MEMHRVLKTLKYLLASTIVWAGLGAMAMIGFAFEPIIGVAASGVTALVASLLISTSICLLWPKQRKQLRIAVNTLFRNAKQDRVPKPEPKVGSRLIPVLTDPIMLVYFGTFWLIRSTFMPIIGEFAAFAAALVPSLLIMTNFSLLWPGQRKKFRIAAAALLSYTKKTETQKTAPKVES